MPVEIIEPDAADLLEYTADLIQEWGLGKGQYMSPEGCLCLRGALAVATGEMAVWINGDIYDYDFTCNEKEWWPAHNHAYDALSRSLNDNIITFSDSHTQKEVVTAARKAAQFAREQGW